MCLGHRHLWRLGRNVGMERLNMNTRFLKRVRAIFASYDAPPEVIRSYQRQWIRSVRLLGDNWLVAKQIQRIEQ
jgi:hypothetical protein